MNISPSLPHSKDAKVTFFLAAVKRKSFVCFQNIFISLQGRRGTQLFELHPLVKGILLRFFVFSCINLNLFLTERFFVFFINLNLFLTKRELLLAKKKGRRRGYY